MTGRKTDVIPEYVRKALSTVMKEKKSGDTTELDLQLEHFVQVSSTAKFLYYRPKLRSNFKWMLLGSTNEKIFDDFSSKFYQQEIWLAVCIANIVYGMISLSYTFFQPYEFLLYLSILSLFCTVQMFLNRIPYLMRLLFTGFDLCFMIFLISLKYISLTITYDFKASYATYFLVGIWPFQVMAFTIEASSATFEMDYRLLIYTLFVIGEMFWFMFSVNGIYRYPKHYALVLPPLTSNSSSPYLIDMFSLHMNDCNGTNGTNYTSSNNYSSSINLTQSPCNSSNVDSIQKFTVTNTTLYQDGSIVFSLLNLIDLCTFVLLLWEIKMLFLVYFFENDCALIYFNAHTKLVKSRDLQNLSSYEVMKRGKVMPLSKKSPGKRGSWNPTPYQAETIRKKLTGAKEKDLDKSELMVIKEKTPNSNNDSEVDKIHVTREEGIYDCSHAKVTVDESSYLACIGLKSTDPVLCFLPARGYTVEAGIHNLVMHKMNLWKNIETTTWIFNLIMNFGNIISWLSVTANILSLCVILGVLPSPVGYTMIMVWIDMFTKILNINPLMLYKLLTFYSFWYFLGLHLLIIPFIILSSNNGMNTFIVVTQIVFIIILLLFRDAQLSFAKLSNHTSRHYIVFVGIILVFAWSIILLLLTRLIPFTNVVFSFTPYKRTFYIGSFELMTDMVAFFGTTFLCLNYLYVAYVHENDCHVLGIPCRKVQTTKGEIPSLLQKRNMAFKVQTNLTNTTNITTWSIKERLGSAKLSFSRNNKTSAVTTTKS